MSKNEGSYKRRRARARKIVGAVSKCIDCGLPFDPRDPDATVFLCPACNASA